MRRGNPSSLVWHLPQNGRLACPKTCSTTAALPGRPPSKPRPRPPARALLARPPKPLLPHPPAAAADRSATPAVAEVRRRRRRTPRRLLATTTLRRRPVSCSLL